jgi:hypothetical protein
MITKFFAKCILYFSKASARAFFATSWRATEDLRSSLNFMARFKTTFCFSALLHEVEEEDDRPKDEIIERK